MTDTTQAGVLYNCCTNFAEPDWSELHSLEIGGCISDEGFTIGGIPDDRAEFWTVYARNADGEAEAITDCTTRADADEVGRKLAEISGLALI